MQPTTDRQPPAAHLSPVRRDLQVSRIRPAYQQVADQIRDLILRGNLGPGDRLPVESELCAIFGVSRSTVREALRLLNSDGLIHTVRGVTGGTFVSHASTERIRDFLETSIGLLSGGEGVTSTELLEARDLLEVPAAGLAARRRTEEHLKVMREVVALETTATERALRFDHHHRFHVTLLGAAGNRLIDVMTVPVFNVIRAKFLHEPADRSFWTSVDNDHQEILDAVTRQDAPAAEAAMRAHLDRLNTSYETTGRRDA